MVSQKDTKLYFFKTANERIKSQSKIKGKQIR